MLKALFLGLSLFLIGAGPELSRCRLCGGKVSVNAKACPHCGEPEFLPGLIQIEEDQLQDRNGVFHAINGEEPYTGHVVEGRYANNRPKARQEYKAGKREGKRLKWYENGQVMQVSLYKDGKVEGVMEEWYETGIKMAEGTYIDGKLHGLVKRWHANGEQEAEYPYRDGKLHGIMIQWNSKGRMISKKEYEDGKLKSRLAVDTPKKETGEGGAQPSEDSSGSKPENERIKRFDDLKFP